MLTLSQTKPKAPYWIDVAVDSAAIRLQITPPDYAHFVRGYYQDSFQELVMVRMECVTGWEGVTDGEKSEKFPDGRAVDFSRENFQALLQQYPPLMHEVYSRVLPLFRGLAEADVKN